MRPTELDTGEPTTSSSSAIKVSVLTPVYNEAAHIARTLERLQDQADPGGEIEFLFVDGASEDDTRVQLHAAAAVDPRIRVLDNPKRTTSAALALALPQARGEYVARMDAHAVYPVDYLAEGVARLSRGDVAAVSGPQIAVGHDPWSRRIAAALGTRLGVGGSNFRRPIEREIETDSGFTGMWRRDLLEALGGWDELAYPNEDSDLAARIRKRGGRLVLMPGLAAEYTPRNSLSALARQYWRYGRARARTARRHPISARPSHALPPSLIVSLVIGTLPLGRVSRVARRGLVLYLSALLFAARTADLPGSEAAYVPLVLSVMHTSWGSGYILGLIHPGPAVKQARG